MKTFFYKFILPPSLIAIILIVGFAIVRQANRNYELHSNVVEIEQKISKLENKNKEADDQIKSFEDVSTIDKEARSRLNLKKEGESVVVILPPKTEKNIVQEIVDDSSEEKSFWNALKVWAGF